MGRIMAWIAGVAVAIAISLSIFNNYSGHGGNNPVNHCLNNVRQIGLAVQGYVNRHGSLPPAYVADASGRPLYSWRVLILPYMDGQAFYNDFNRSEPWDSPENLKLLGRTPSNFRCWSQTHAGGTRWGHNACTSYFALRGPSTAFPGSAPVPIDKITDPLGRTILLVESDQGDVPWSAPVDIDMATGSLTGSVPGGPTGPVSPHKSGINIGMADGSARHLKTAAFSQSMAPMSTISGGEAVEIRDK